MGDHQAGSPLQAGQVAQKLRFGLFVQRTGAFIQQQHRRLCQDGPRDGNALRLPFRNAQPPFSQHGIQSIRQGADPFFQAGRLCRSQNGFLVRRLRKHGDIFPQGTGKQRVALGHIGKKFPRPHANGYASGLFLAGAVQQQRDAAAVRLIHSQKQSKQRGFSLAGKTGDGHKITCVNDTVQPPQYRPGFFVIAKLHIFQPDFLQRCFPGTRRLLLRLLGKHRQFPDTLRGGNHGIYPPGDAGRAGNRPLHLIGKLEHGCQHAIAEAAPVDPDTAPNQTQEPRKLKRQIDPVVHRRAEIPFLDLRRFQPVFPLPDFLRQPLPGAAGLDQQQIFQHFLQQGMVACLCLRHHRVPFFHRRFQRGNQRQTQQTARNQYTREPPVHPNQQDHRTGKAHCHTGHVGQSFQNSVFDHLNIGQHPADHLAAVEPRQTGILFFHQL